MIPDFTFPNKGDSIRQHGSPSYVSRIIEKEDSLRSLNLDWGRLEYIEAVNYPARAQKVYGYFQDLLTHLNAIEDDRLPDALWVKTFLCLHTNHYAGAILAARGVVALQPNSELSSFLQEVDARSVRIRYKNWKGVERLRHILPIQCWYGATNWHPKPGWLLSAVDLEELEDRNFSIADIKEWQSVHA